MQTDSLPSGSILDWTLYDDRLVLQHQRGVTQCQEVGPGILRIHYHPEGSPFPKHLWEVVHKPEAAALLSASQAEEAVLVQARSCCIRVDLETGCLSFERDGVGFGADLRGPHTRILSRADTCLEPTAANELPPGPGCAAVSLDKRILPGEHYFGVGQRSTRLERRRYRFTHWNTDVYVPGHAAGHDNLYQSHPVIIAMRPYFCWGLFLNSTWYSEFDVGASSEERLRILTLGGELDYFVFSGPTPQQTVEQLTRLTGRPQLPPLWSLGFHQSRWGYTTGEEIEALAEEFRRHRIPLDAIHLDIDHMREFRVFTWDPQRFPQPEKMIERLHRQNVRTVAIVDPGVKYDLSEEYRVASEGLAHDAFIRTRGGDLFRGFVWAGESLFPDFSREPVRHWWGEQHETLLQAGVDGIWTDMNEPAIVDRPIDDHDTRSYPIPLDAPQGGVEAPSNHAELHNLYGSLMALASFDALQRARPSRRPWVLTRSAFTGAQRYAATWMGDNRSRWEDLALSLPQLASMGICGMPHTGVDIGGFFENCYAELYARWMELAPFYPFMRCHAATGTRSQEPWAFGPEVEQIARQAIELRYRLLPYLYTLAHLSHRTGAPILRPLFYDFPEQPEFYPIDDQVMFGPYLLIAPILRPGAKRRLVELPEGSWYDFWTGIQVTERALIAESPWGRPPIFVRGGALLTLGNIRQSTRETLSELTIELYPGAEGDWLIIEDDGESREYQSGKLAETRLESRTEADRVSLTVHPRQGDFRPAPRRIVASLHLSAPPQALQLNDKIVRDWQWQTEKQTAIVTWVDAGGKAEVVALI